MQRYVDRLKEGRKRIFADAEEMDIPDILQRAREWFLNKKVVTKLEFVKLSAEMRWKSFTVARVTDNNILEDFKSRLNEALKSGIATEDFLTDIDLVFDSMGVTKLNPYHLETVFLTNTMSGYGEGRKQIVDNLLITEFPYRQIIVVDDERVRGAHRPLGGYTAAKDDSVWNWLKTPFSYRCRCLIVPVHKSEGLTPSGYIPDVRGKAGFEFLR